MVDVNIEGPTVREEISFGLQQSRIVSAIATWCEALHGSATLTQAFADLCDGLEAQAGMLVRTRRSDGRQHRIALHDPGAEQSCGRPLRLSLAGTVFGSALDTAKAGSVWQEDEPFSTTDPFLGEFQAARGFRDFYVLVLASGSLERDHIELHFRTPRSERVHSTLATVLPTVARTWAARDIGIVSKEMSHRRTEHSGIAAPNREPVLGPGNPARLSRSEYRICLMLSRGLSAKGVAAELGVSELTVRSHLRSIYAKTQTASQSELLFQLIGPQLPGTSTEMRYA